MKRTILDVLYDHGDELEEPISPHGIRTAAEELERIEPGIHFKGYPKTQRIDKLVYTLTEKIDGTNAGIIVPENPDCPLIATSKNGCISVEKDNQGFATWVKENELSLRSLRAGHHFGEWYGNKINRGYGLDTRRFMLFNRGRYLMGDGQVAYPVIPECCEVETVLVHDVPIEHLHYRLAMYENFLKERGSFQVPGYMRPEGIIIRDIFGRVMKHVFDK